MSEEASIKHLVDDPSCFIVILLLSLDDSELLLEAVDRLEFILDGLLLGESGSLSIKDLLLGPSPGGGSLHPK